MTTAVARRRRLEYLDKASLALALTAPSTAAALGAEALRLRREGPAENVDQQQLRRQCERCGAILVPGRSSSITLQRQHKRGRVSASGNGSVRSSGGQPRCPSKGLDANSKAASACSTVVRCLVCSHESIGPPFVHSQSIVGKQHSTTQRLSSTDIAHHAGVDGPKSQTAQASTLSTLSAIEEVEVQDEQRKRNRKRKKGGGLHSLLSQAQRPNASRDALGLMDFLVKD